jgi:hypothetical protein
MFDVAPLVLQTDRAVVAPCADGHDGSVAEGGDSEEADSAPAGEQIRSNDVVTLRTVRMRFSNLCSSLV